MEEFAFFLHKLSSLKREKLFIPLWRRGDMRVKKILSLLTLVFLILFLVVSAFPEDGTDPKPDPDADPWNETGSAPYHDGDDDNVIIITVSYISAPPYFTFTAQKLDISSASAVKKVSKSTHTNRRTKVVR